MALNERQKILWSALLKLRRFNNPQDDLAQEVDLQRRASALVRDAVVECIARINSSPNQHLPPPPLDRQVYRFDISFDDAPWSPRSFSQGFSQGIKIPYIS